jgi:hypothetical protein
MDGASLVMADRLDGVQLAGTDHLSTIDLYEHTFSDECVLQVPDLDAYRRLVLEHGEDHRGVPRGGRILRDFVCDRRSHLLGRVFAVEAGILSVFLYDSGRATRKQSDGTVLRTIKFVKPMPVLLDADAFPDQVVTVRCDCTTVDLDAAARQIVRRFAGARMALPSALSQRC